MMTDTASFVFGSDTIEECKEITKSEESRKYIRFHGLAQYTITFWDLSKLCLTPHVEFDNSFWVAYAGHRIGMISMEFEGEIGSEICVIRPSWVAHALCSDISFTADSPKKAIVQLMLNGVL